jgi:hypothetical protein
MLITQEICDARVRAEAKFKFREKQKADAPQALLDYRAAQQAARDQMQRLRAQRIAAQAEVKPSLG